MPENRLDTLKSLVAQNPADSFMRYGLAMAHAGAGDHVQAVEEYRKLIEVNPKYVAAYFHGGQALERYAGQPRIGVHRNRDGYAEVHARQEFQRHGRRR